MMGRQWAVWRVVLAQAATLHEIETHWSMVDLLRANLALDVQHAVNKPPTR